MPERERAAMFRQFAETVPAKRYGQPEDIAQSVLYLMNNAFTTGSTLFVDGGLSPR